MIRELLRQALDALDRSADRGNGALKDALRSALAAPMPEPPDMAMVPRKPTQAMLDAVKFSGTAYHVWNLMIAAAPPAAPAPVVPDALVEAVAKAIYWEWRRDAGYVPWVDGGNSDKQYDARKIARAVVSSAAPVVPEDMTVLIQRVRDAAHWQLIEGNGDDEQHRTLNAAADALEMLSAAPVVPDEKLTARRVAREVFAVCEQFEELSDGAQDSQEVERFKAGQRFAAKRIRTAIGIWLTDEENAPSAAPVVREPLTIDQVVDAFCKLPHRVQSVAIFQAGVDFAESHHGIRGGK